MCYKQSFFMTQVPYSINSGLYCTSCWYKYFANLWLPMHSMSKLSTFIVIVLNYVLWWNFLFDSKYAYKTMGRMKTWNSIMIITCVSKICYMVICCYCVSNLYILLGTLLLCIEFIHSIRHIMSHFVKHTLQPGISKWEGSDWLCHQIIVLVIWYLVLMFCINVHFARLVFSELTTNPSNIAIWMWNLFTWLVGSGKS